MTRYLPFFILLFIVHSTYSQNRILLDELQNDWTNITTAWTSSGSTNGISLNSFKVTNDDQFLFIYFDSDNVYSLQNYDGLKIYIDSDNNSSTGYSTDNIGAEIVFNFGQRSGIAYLNGSRIDIAFADLFMVTCPTVDSDWFEIALSRNAVIGNSSIFSSDDIKLILADESVGNGSKTDVISYTFSDGIIDPLPSYSLDKKSINDLRVVSHNVEFDGFFEEGNKPSFERLYEVINPDIIGFSEIYNHSGNDVANRLEEILPSPEGQNWNAANIADNFVATRYTIKNSWSAGGFGNGVFLLDLRPDYDTDALVVVAHPPCCDNDANRQKEIDAIMAFIRLAKEPGGAISLEENTPIIIMGDMNLVGDPQQLATLLTGDIVDESTYGSDFTPDWNGSDLLDAKPMATDLPMTFTQGVGDYPGSFSKGRLDYIIYSGSALSLQNSFVLYTNGLSQTILNEYGLLSGDTEWASDHFPVVADFKLNGSTSSSQNIETIRLNDAEGSPQLLNTLVTVNGIVTVANEFGNSGPAYMQDETGGVAIFGGELLSGLQIGDNITITSPVGFYNGLTEFVYDANNSNVTVNSSGNGLTPTVVTIDQILNQSWNGFEEFEAMLVEIKDVTIAESGVFTAATNYTISDGQSTMQLRIDNAVNLAGVEIPEEEFTVIGVISQFDNSPPYDEGYYILPRFIEDIQVKEVTKIGDIRINNGEGVPELLNEIVTVSGVVTVNNEFGDAGPRYIQDETAGMAIYGSDFADQFNIGDSVSVTGKLVQFNGLTEISYDELNFAVEVHKNNASVQPATVTIGDILNQTWNGLEEYEGMLVKIENATIQETGIFAEGTNYTLTDATGSMVLRIDNDVNIVGQEIAKNELTVTAIVGQYDNSSPYSEGYQLQPRKISDLEFNQFIKSIELLSPLVGAEFNIGETVPISWTSENVNSVSLYYTLPGSDQETVIVENADAGPGEYSGWAAPENVDSLTIVIRDTDDDTIYDQSGVIYIKDPVGVDDNSFPEEFTLYNNYPNPFNPGTTIRYFTPNSSNINLQIYNSLGQQVFIESFTNQPAGYYEYYWDASALSSGLYFYSITVLDNIKLQSQKHIGKMLLVK